MRDAALFHKGCFPTPDAVACRSIDADAKVCTLYNRPSAFCSIDNNMNYCIALETARSLTEILAICHTTYNAAVGVESEPHRGNHRSDNQPCTDRRCVNSSCPSIGHTARTTSTERTVLESDAMVLI
jgi:hypothetical protein